MRDIPEFIIAGSPRSGTGWLLSCLIEHPDVYIPSREIHYFSYEYDRSPSWYLANFDEKKPEQKSVEKSPSYLEDPAAAERIYDWNPEVQLIFSLRNPVERAYSAYCMALRSGFVGEEIQKELTPDASMVQNGRYFELLRPYRKRFPEEQLNFLIFDDLKAEPRKFARNLFSILGVTTTFKPSILSRKFGHTKKRGGKIWRKIQSLVFRVSRASDLFNSSLQWLRRRGWTEWIHNLRPGSEYPSLDDSLRKDLRKYYKSDVDRLRSFLGRDLPDWPA